MVQAVIFDMDGVLVDSQPLHFKADLEVLLRAGVEGAVLEDVVKNAGMSNADRWVKYKNDFSLSHTPSQLIDIHVQVITELLQKDKDIKAIAGVKELLEYTKSLGLKRAVASSSSYSFIYMMLNKLEIKDSFDIIVSGEDMKNSKPSPDIFLATAEKLNVAPNSCVVIEDSQNGVLAAVAAEMACVGYINESSGNQDLSKAHYLISDFNKLIGNTNWLNIKAIKKEGLNID